MRAHSSEQSLLEHPAVAHEGEGWWDQLGLVDGKTNTKYAWDVPQTDGVEPEEWFHEVFRKDGTPYRQEEGALIKELNTAPAPISKLQTASQ